MPITFPVAIARARLRLGRGLEAGRAQPRGGLRRGQAFDVRERGARGPTRDDDRHARALFDDARRRRGDWLITRPVATVVLGASEGTGVSPAARSVAPAACSLCAGDVGHGHLFRCRAAGSTTASAITTAASAAASAHSSRRRRRSASAGSCVLLPVAARRRHQRCGRRAPAPGRRHRRCAYARRHAAGSASRARLRAPRSARPRRRSARRGPWRARAARPHPATGGIAGFSSLGGRGSAETCLKAIATAVSPSNGTAPVSSSYRITPTE